ncbi:hypothetical protein [Blastococcus sp. SYSU D00820]
MRWGIRAAGLSLALFLTACSGGGGGAAASCAGPHAMVSPPEARVGEEVVLTVDRLFEGCDDTGGTGDERPLTDVPVGFVQGGVRVPVGTVSSTAEDSTGRLVFRVPDSASPGPAQVTVFADDRLAVDLAVRA